MQVLLFLFLVGLILVVPVIAIAALSRSAALSRQIRDLQADLSALEARVGALAKRVAADRATPAPERTVPAEKASAPPTAPVPAPAPPVALPATEATTAVASAGERPAPSPALKPPLPPPTPRAPGGPPRPRPPEAQRPSGPPPPRTPSFDWESLLGLKGAAWAGGIALVVAAMLLVKLAIAAGIITPELRIALLVGTGVGALVWAEVSLRKGYSTTSNAVSGAGIAVLYVAFYAAHGVYHLFGFGLTFALMALVTVVAGLLAVRYDAMLTAVLGLLGGFATPLALSTGEDRPVGLFSYILLLNLGLLSVALHKRWHVLVGMGLVGTFVIEIGWFGRFMSPEKMVVGLVAFLIFGVLYLLLPLFAEGQEQRALLQAGALGGIAPFLFAVFLAGNRRYAGEWPLLFAYVGLLDAALAAIALFRGRVGLLVSGAIATAITLPLWAAQGLDASALWGSTLAVIVLGALLNLPTRLARRFAPGVLEQHRVALEAAGLIAGVGLGTFGLAIVGHDLGEPPWPFVVLLAALAAILLERAGEDRVTGVMYLAPPAVAILIQIWFFNSTGGEALLRNLSVPLLFTLVLSLASARRAAARVLRRGASDVHGDEDEAGVVESNLVAVLGLFLCLADHDLGSDPWPLFAALAVGATLFVASALRRDWTVLVPVGLVASASLTSLWHVIYYQPADLGVAVPWYLFFYLAFLVLPFAMPESLAARWQKSPSPWFASALSGPLFFFALYRAVVVGWGNAYIGILPVLLGALSVAALAGVSRRFAAPGRDAEAARLRLRYLALFAAVALGFVALAIPLQLEKQWITIGWALEAAAVWWLFGRLPHVGLRAFGAVLYVLVGVRLLLNLDNVLAYEERGLPILNWLLYTYGVPALCCLVGASFLRRAEVERGPAGGRLAPAASLLGLVLIFALINLEIADYFSAGRYVEFSGERRIARDLAMSVAWGIYAMVLLVIGLWRRVQALRFISLGFLLLTVGKVFLYDLSNLSGVYRVLSFLGLGVSLILVSLLYQRFVFRKQGAS